MQQNMSKTGQGFNLENIKVIY